MHWIKNGPEVKKPCGDCLIRTKDGFTDIAQWSHDPDCLVWSNTQNVYCDDEVAHFAVIASPLSGSRTMIDPNLLREITEKVRGIAECNAIEWRTTTAALPSEVSAVCQAAEIGLLLLGAFDSPAAAIDYARFEYVAKQNFDAAALCRAWRDTLKGADDENRN